MGSNKLFPFSTVVFASWDYHLTDAGAARNLRHSIRNQLKEMVNDALLEDKIEDTRTKIKAYIRKVCFELGGLRPSLLTCHTHSFLLCHVCCFGLPHGGLKKTSVNTLSCRDFASWV